MMQKLQVLYSLFLIIFVCSVKSQVDLQCPATELCAGSNDGELTCTVTDGNSLVWKIVDNGMESGTIEYNKNHPLMNNDVVGMAIANLIEVVPLESTLKFTPLEGMVVQCSRMNDMSAQSCPIAIAGVPSAPINLTLSQYTNSSVQLSWSSPNDSPDCIDMYSVSSNITSIITTSDVMVTLKVPNNHISTNQYCASVAAVDYIEQTGQKSIESCFILDVPNPLDVNYSVDENLTITWTSNQMLRPPLKEINVIVTNANDNMSNMLQLAPDIRTIAIIIHQMEVTLIFKVTVIATNVIGSDKGTTIQVTVDHETTSVTSTQTQSTTTFSTISPVHTTTMPTTAITMSKVYTTTSTGNTFGTTSGIPSITGGVYTSSTDIDEVMPTISTIPHTSTITSVSITTSPSSSPPLNQQSGAPWPVIGGAVGGVLVVLIIIIPVVIGVCVVRMKKKRSEEYDINTLGNEAYRTVDLYGTTRKQTSEFPLVRQTCTVENEPVYDLATAVEQPKEQCTYQDPKLIRREQAPSTGDLYTIPQGKTKSERDKDSDAGNYAELSLNDSSHHSRSQMATTHQLNTGNESLNESVTYAEIVQ